MKFDTVIFDLDGTLLNSIGDLVDSTNAVLAQMGYTPRTYEEIKNFVGNGVRVLIEKALPDDVDEAQISQCIARFHTYYPAHMLIKTKPYQDIYPLIIELQKREIKMAIISNKHDTETKALCAHFFKDFIPVAIGERAGVPRKPDPINIFEALKELGAKPEQALYVGDTEVDIQTARNAGLPSVGVLWGFRSEQVLRSAGADYIIEQPLQLLNIVDK